MISRYLNLVPFFFLAHLLLHHFFFFIPLSPLTSILHMFTLYSWCQFTVYLFVPHSPPPSQMSRHVHSAV